MERERDKMNIEEREDLKGKVTAANKLVRSSVQDQGTLSDASYSKTTSTPKHISINFFILYKRCCDGLCPAGCVIKV